MILLDGKQTSLNIQNEIKAEVQKRVLKGFPSPYLVAVLVGEDGASQTYVNSKIRACQRVGFLSSLIKLDKGISEEALLKEINNLNKNNKVDGYIVQLPLPKHIDEAKVVNAISPEKDVDGFHPLNFGKLALEQQTFIPATPFGIIELLKRYKIETKGKHVVVIGRSHIVGRPISILLSQKSDIGNASVTLIHSASKNISNITNQADIIVVALGKPNFLTKEMVKKGVTIIDVGITRVQDTTITKGYKIVGDVDFDNISEKCYAITPVPGGVGPMTIAMLLKNTLIANVLKHG